MFALLGLFSGLLGAVGAALKALIEAASPLLTLATECLTKVIRWFGESFIDGLKTMFTNFKTWLVVAVFVLGAYSYTRLHITPKVVESATQECKAEIKEVIKYVPLEKRAALKKRYPQSYKSAVRVSSGSTVPTRSESPDPFRGN